MSTCKITYNGSEISSAEETAPVIVTYGGNQIASVSDDESKTLNCNGLYMTGNVVVGSKTMNCSGTVMVSDVLISVECSAVSGETWLINDTPNWNDINGLYFNFISNNIQFIGIRVGGPPWNQMYFYVTPDSNQTVVCDKKSGWLMTEFKTIILEEPASGDLLTWLQANATKIS